VVAEQKVGIELNGLFFGNLDGGVGNSGCWCCGVVEDGEDSVGGDETCGDGVGGEGFGVGRGWCHYVEDIGM